MRAPRRKRQMPRRILVLPESLDLDALAATVSYVGSPEHKDVDSFAGSPRPRADATICDASFVSRLAELNDWLRQAVRRGCIGTPWEGNFPRYAWYRDGDIVYEARLVNRGTGEYKGYALTRHEWPDEIGDFYE